MLQNQFYSKEESAIFLGVSVSTLNSWIQRGRIVPKKFGRKCFFSKEDLDNLLITPMNPLKPKEQEAEND